MFKIIHPKHSGRLMPHEHTSYVTLLVILLIVGAVLVKFSMSYVFAQSPGPQEGSVALEGNMPQAPPKDVATITNPKNGQHFTISPIAVSGTCTVGNLVQIYKNKIFAGSTPCDNDGKFSLQVDLLYGKNVLTAQQFDALNQAGPISSAVTVYYDTSFPVFTPISFFDLSNAQLIISTDAVYRGTFPNQLLNVPITIIGGKAPYAVNVEWGDGSNTLFSRSNTQTFNAPHKYKKAGTFAITIQATDAEGRAAFLQVAAVINGTPVGVASASSSQPPASKFLLLWILLAVAITFVISFWLGERREKKILMRQATIQNPFSGAVAPTPKP